MVSSVISKLLACPVCISHLIQGSGYFECQHCHRAFPIHNGIPVFSTPESSSQSDAEAIAFRKRYEWRYYNQESARTYDQSFHKSFRKRSRTHRERYILETLLKDQRKCNTVLNIPCGGGRLSPPIANKSAHLIEADISPAQLDLAMNLAISHRHGMVISALELPFRPDSVDGVVCARLSHHLPDAGEREKLLSELLRVVRKFVVFSFTDRRSIKSFGRKLRGKPLNPCAMSVQEIADIANAKGAGLCSLMTVSNVGPRHRFALLQKK